MPNARNASDVTIKESRCIVEALPPELLWKIFMINTERYIPYKAFGLHFNEPDSRLDTARSCSQVCRLWRKLLLQSSSVWGRLLHIQSFENTADEWREAVISRVGDAPLWIIGRVSISTRPYILSILQSKWESVQVLAVKDRDLYDGQVLPAWSFLEREAPALEVFKLWIDSFYMDAQHILPFSPLFRNAAPRLKSFMTSIPFQLTLPAPWLANLHSVTFNRLQSVPTILSALKFTPHLEHLYISGDATQHPIRHHAQDGDVSKPHLPLLESLIINGLERNPEDLGLLLESISLAPGQLRRLCISQADAISLEPYQQRLQRSITKWIHAYMEASSPHYLILWGHNESHLYLTMRPTQDAEEQMDVSLAFDSHSYLTIKNIAQSSQFRAVETLYIFLRPSRWPLRPLYDALQFITHLTACGPDIRALFHDMLQFSLFPHLCTINLQGGHLQDDSDSELLESTISKVMDFLEHRASIGSPISVLELSPARVKFVSGMNEERLERIPGLTVMFKEDD
ncbi:hypothetical protein D9613_011859 [Agrocybe pediades]|uniref:F-box domain-containing protein n=1 Tax=Agrocybe pediades TaxID=84607 RepID=A0A8H4VK30_9AGAR|nr:hypothetical protein D9613_011859 [Agrocybe pediades]